MTSIHLGPSTSCPIRWSEPNFGKFFMHFCWSVEHEDERQ